MKRSLFPPVLTGLFLVAALPVLAHAAESTAPAAAPRDNIYVDATQILYLESWPVQVTLEVRGSLPTPCHKPMWAVTVGDEAIDVQLWSEADPGQMCAAVLEPIELSIPLGSFETADLPVLLDGKLVGTVEIGMDAGEPVRLTGAGWSFGMCLGYCNADLVIDGDQLTLTGSDRDADGPLFVNMGTLTELGLESLAGSLADVEGTALEATYGCPDCADGGAAYLALVQAEEQSRHDMEFAQPPEELAAAYALTGGLMSALETCRSGDLVTVSDECTPAESR